MTDIKRPLVFGGGFLGKRIATEFNAPISGVRIEFSGSVLEAVEKYRPDIIFNAAGRGGAPSGEEGPRNIDWCIMSEENRRNTWASNVIGPDMLDLVCGLKGIRLVHISSGCIFDGPSPNPGGWTEEDEPCPVSYYSETKVSGEKRLEDSNALIIRPRLPMDWTPHPRNTLTKLAGYPNVMGEVINSVTMVDSMVFAIRQLVNKEATGTFHVTNPGPVLNEDIMGWYRAIVDPDHRCSFKPPQWFYDEKLALDKRSNCVLNTSKLERAGVHLTDAGKLIRDALRIYRGALSE